MIRKIAFLAFALLFALSGTITAVAQDATPAATGPVTGPALGDAVTWIGNDGKPVGTITIDEVIDPYPTTDAAYPPSRGYRYIGLLVTVENTSDATLSIDPSDYFMVDDSGFFSYATYSYSVPAGADYQPLTYGDLEAGDTVSGAISFNLFEGAKLSAVYLNTDDQLTTVLNLGDAPSSGGEPVSVTGPDGSPLVAVTVNTVLDPFENYSSSSAPERGYRYIAIDLTIENLSDAPLTVDTSRFAAVDSDGFLADSTYYIADSDEEIAEFSYAPIPAGETQVGRVYFQALIGADISRVLYFSQYSDNRQFVILADAGPDGFSSSEVVLPTPVPVSEDCNGADQWYSDVLDEIITNLSPLIDSINALQDADEATLNPSAILGVKDSVDGVSANLAELAPPPAAEAFQQLMLASLNDLSQALDDLATAVDGNDSAAIAEAKTKVATIIDDVMNGDEVQGAFDDLLEACPNTMNLAG
jgi:hypothetical protein